VFWAFLLGVLPITLVYLGGLEPLKSAVTLVSVPLYAVIVVLTLSMWKSIKQAEKDKARSSDASLSEVS
jgi:BCCT family betaine/carnitine transporter